METARQASRLGGVEGSWGRHDEVKKEIVAGWVKIQTRIYERHKICLKGEYHEQ